jgi:hypothetical protein
MNVTFEWHPARTKGPPMGVESENRPLSGGRNLNRFWRNLTGATRGIGTEPDLKQMLPHDQVELGKVWGYVRV